MVPLWWAGLLIFAGCAPGEQPIEVRYEITAKLNAGTTPQAVQFYVHEVELLDSGGQSHPLTLNAVLPWQSERVALLDVSPEGARRHVIEGRAARRQYTGVRFTVGVPVELNHANPLAAAAPLNRAELFWSWQSGYKFLRFELSAVDHAAAFHLGSTGCSSASALRPPTQPCGQPNAMRVELRGFDPSVEPIQVRIDELVAAMQGAQGACTGDYARDKGCADAFALTGLDAATGRCANGSSTCAQRLFVVGSVDQSQ